ncbi:MAG: hypothetical protein CSA29_01965 [Desulfobacterales bacterium]|nr:MAG: hypothetical protein CSA29_01965 [Desulfobacterales bacterium]
MPDNKPAAYNVGPGYFGKMTASVSHELKNCLAIMNENNGLTQDLTAMALKGRPLDPERLNTVAERISIQIQRADRLLKQMNRFAHSSDRSQEQVDVDEAVTLAVNLGARLAANQRVDIQVEPFDAPLSLTTSFFGTLNLLWQTIEAVMSVMDGEDKVLTIRIFKDSDLPCVALNIPGPFLDTIDPALEKADVHYLCTCAGAALRVIPDNGQITLTFGNQ